MFTRHLVYLSTCVLLLCILIAGCGKRGNRFRLEGKMKNLNQGELYIYAQDGSGKQTDTIRIDKGKFVYEVECERPTTFILVFPNFSQHPVFGEPGKSASLKGDATNLKELEIEGTDDNDAMTAYRMQVAHAAPPDVKTLTEKFILDHAASPVAIYLIRQHYVDTQKPDYTKALQLMAAVREAQPHSPEAELLVAELSTLQKTGVGNPLPPFTLTTINGTVINEKTASQSPVTTIMTYADWSNESMAMLRRANYLLKNNEASFQFIVINLNADVALVKRFAEQEQIKGHIVCSEKMFEEPGIKALALTTVPDNIIVRNGKIAVRGLPIEKFVNALKQ